MTTKVLIIESEAGWGQKVEDKKEFNTKEEAVQFCIKFNEPNNKEQVPDWYMYAVLEEEY